jgi:glycine/D-amino acid oxidase-like deaminating enzyme
MSLIHLDYLIIGQGLAGSVLALKLLKRGKKILVVDQPRKNIASRVAAGLFNPITGKKMVKTWLADKLFPALHTHYKEAEALTGDSFFHHMPIYRPFGTIEEQNEWMGRSPDPAFTSYVETVQTEPMINYVQDPYGGLLLKECGYLDTTGYLNSVRNVLEGKDSFLEDYVEEGMILTDDGIQFGSYMADRVVYCNGTHQNKFFNWLPIRPLKGEILVIAAEGTDNVIINRGVYLVPHTEGQWRVGATYNFGDLEPRTTSKSREELLSRLEQLVRFPFEVIGQEWGLRPTTPDRRPILGQHPEHARVWTMNGMGTKGVSLAPYCADLLIRSMENGDALNKEVNIERYKSLYWTS